MRYTFFFSIIFIAIQYISPQIKFIPFTINGSPVDNMVIIGENSFYISTNSYLLKTVDNFHTFDTLYHSNSSIFMAVDTTYRPADRIIIYPNPEYISLDGGKTWNPFKGITYNPDKSESKYAFVGDNIYATDEFQLFQLTNDGTILDTIPVSIGFSDRILSVVSDGRQNLYITKQTFQQSAYGFSLEYSFLKKTINSWNYLMGSGVTYTLLFNWQTGTSPDYFSASSLNGTTSFYNTITGKSRAVNGYSDHSMVDKLGNIYLLKDQAITDYSFYLEYSSDWGKSWIKNTLNYKVAKMLIDDYGTIYLINYSGSMKTEKPVYKYISTDSINFGNASLPDTNFQTINVYNPLKSNLSLDSVSFTNSSFFPINFSPVTIAPSDSVYVTIGFSTKDTDDINSNAILHFGKLSLQIKLNGNGRISGIDDYKKHNTSFELFQNYPNPFNPSTQIQYSLLTNSNVKVIIYNSLGETVRELANENQHSGVHVMNFNAGGLSSGVYFYSIQANSVDGSQSFRATKKMILMK